MNAARRKELEELTLQLQQAVEKANSIRDGEQEAFDNLPDSIQASEKGDMMDATVQDIDSLIAIIEEATDLIDSITV
jgi:hypothetical protein